MASNQPSVNYFKRTVIRLSLKFSNSQLMRSCKISSIWRFLSLLATAVKNMQSIENQMFVIFLIVSLFRKLIWRCPSIRSLTIGRGVSLCDEDVIETVHQGVLNNLETLTITESDNKELTIQAVEYILEHCSRLKHLSELRYLQL